jgi:hypothetical protein
MELFGFNIMLHHFFSLSCAAEGVLLVEKKGEGFTKLPT